MPAGSWEGGGIGRKESPPEAGEGGERHQEKVKRRLDWDRCRARRRRWTRMRAGMGWEEDEDEDEDGIGRGIGERGQSRRTGEFER